MRGEGTRTAGGEYGGVVVVERQGTRGHNASDGRAGVSVRHPNVVADALELVPHDLLEPPPVAVDHVVVVRADLVPVVELERLAVADERVQILRPQDALFKLIRPARFRGRRQSPEPRGRDGRLRISDES